MSGELRFTRLRPLRETAEARLKNAETSIDVSQMIYPMFVMPGKGVRQPVAPMPGQYQMSVDVAVEKAQEALELGVDKVLLFGLPERKDASGSAASDPNEAVQRAVREIKKANPAITVITDVCLCEYTDHGHCGLVTPEGQVDNDATLPLLAAAAVSHAEAGADIVAPSAMMDGQVAAIKAGLRDAGFPATKVMGYSAKYASSFYGPFRAAVDSAPQFGDRKSYQMSPTQSDEAMAEIEADIAEGADFIMVKPALAYLDIIRRAADRFDLPLAAYNVSGEYAAIKAAAANGWIDEETSALEVLVAIRRAGADLLITYFALDAARWLDRNR
ncbi:MAG: porphobilinogen synthase [Chloroflexi bacterium]|nr:porphobilinogen synthase [Chloroflexota bacterium]